MRSWLICGIEVTSLLVVGLSLVAAQTDCSAIDGCTSCEDPRPICTTCKSNTYRKNEYVCLSCSLGCTTCVDTNDDGVTECTACQSGYFLDSNKTCTLCPSDCTKCQGAYACNSCEVGYHYKLKGTECLDCPDHCLLCSKNTQCNLCEDYYYLTSTNQCSRCASGCIECAGSTCTRCEEGKTYNGNICVDCPANCETCIFDGGCRRCMAGYSLSADYSTCLPCTNCATCPSMGGCTQCEVGYALDTDATCWPCLDIDTPYICNQCTTQRGARLYTQEQGCLYCPFNCLSCSATDECELCFDGFFINEYGLCEPCGPTCATCVGAADVCTTCSNGYGIDYDHNCIMCHDHVTDCIECLTDVCIECTEGMYVYTAPMIDTPNIQHTCYRCLSTTDFDVNSFSASMCLQCQRYATYLTDEYCRDCPENCRACTKDGCYQCGEGFALTAQGLCVRADDREPMLNCQVVFLDVTNGIELCQLCDENYFFYPNLTCVSDHILASDKCLLYESEDITGGTCLQCEHGLYWDKIEEACVEPAYNGHCVVYAVDEENVGAPSLCLQCETRYYPVAGVCAPARHAVDNCVVHARDGFCERCENGYFVDINRGHCIDCEDVDPDLNQYVCEHCSGHARHEYQFWKGRCYDCPLGCKSCSGPEGCDECEEGKYYEGTKCVDITCTSITTPEQCEACSTEERGKYWQGPSTCADCPLNCALCSRADDCDECVVGYAWDLQLRKCLLCDYTTEEACTNCVIEDRGHYLTAYPAQCLLCPELCVQCTETGRCTKCHTSAYMYHGECHSCWSPELQDIHCTECNDNGAYYPARVWSDGWCAECSAYCLACDSPGTCREDSCIQGRFWHQQGGVCRDCIVDCLRCSDGFSCDECDVDMYYIPATHECRECDEHCTSCNSTSVGCTQCESGYFLQRQTCLRCDLHINNCLQCSNSTMCTECDSGFHLTEGRCRACIDNCLACTDSESCDTCNEWTCYDVELKKCRLSGTHTCDKCRLVEGALTCLSCPKERYYYGVCQACTKDHCTKCSEDIDICERCAKYYYLLDGECTDCPHNCERCRNMTVCYTCKAATYWNETTLRCEDCPPQCSSCVNSTSCTTCASSSMFFHPQEFECHKCIDGCSSCSSIEDCHTCSAGYYRDGNEWCGACPTSCQACQNRGTREEPALMCYSCYSGYYKKSDTDCYACSDTFANCNECRDWNGNDQIDTGECSSCASGYMLNNDKSRCLKCSYYTTGCSVCEDPELLCNECEEGRAPTSDKSACGYECFQCYGSGCSNRPIGGRTALIGCTDSCWSAKKIDNGTEQYYRGCLSQQCSTSYLEVEVCQLFSDNVTDCRKCCQGAQCNNHILYGEEILNTSSLLTVTSSLYVLITAAVAMVMQVVLHT